MVPVLAFTIVMLVWVIGEFVSTKTNALVSMMLVASLIFLVGFAADVFPHDLIERSGLLHLGNAVIGVIIVHLGTMMSMEDLKAQWRTFVIGSMTVVVMTVILIFVSQVFFDINIAIAGTAAITGGTLSVLMVQDEIRNIVAQVGSGGLGQLSSYLLLVFPLLILNFKNLVGFLVTAQILKKEAKRIQTEYRAGNMKLYEEEVAVNKDNSNQSVLPPFLQTAYGTLFLLGLTVYVSMQLSALTNGYLNTFVIALLLGIILRHFKVFRPNALSTTDTFGLLMISIMVIAFGALADIEIADLVQLIWPLIYFLVAGVVIILAVSYILGRIVGYSGALAMAVGMTTFYGFPGTMVLSKEAANAVGETEEEKAVIEQNILPIMVTAGFSTITITSVIIGGIIVTFLTALV